MENPVLLVSDSPPPRGGVRCLRVDLIGQRVVEVDLRCELIASSGLGVRADLEMNMDGPARIPAGIDRLKADRAVGVRRLIAT